VIYLLVKALLSGVVVAVASETARRWPGWGALIVSLPLVSILAMIWLWRDTGDRARMAAHSEATFWFVVPSLPMFLLIPYLLRQGLSFWAALFAGCALTVVLYSLMVWVGPKFGLRL
jgi:polyferredoxin